MPTNEILPFCPTDTGTNLLTQAEYLATSQRTNGNQPGIASAKLVNKAIRQSAFIAAQFAQYISNVLNQDVLDNADNAAFQAQIVASFTSQSFANEFANLGIATSVATSALTIALKQGDGSTNPGAGSSSVKIGMRSATAATGGYNLRSVASALSLVLSSGTTLQFKAATAMSLWLYLIDSDGTGANMKLGASIVQYDDTQLQSTVKEAFSCTATSASPAVFTANNHGMQNGSAIQLTGTPPTGFSTATTYFVVSSAPNTFQLSATAGGSSLNSSSTGSAIVAHMADSSLVSDGVYSSVPIKLIGQAILTEATPGVWATNSSSISVGPQKAKTISMMVGLTSSSGTIGPAGGPVPYDTQINDPLNCYNAASKGFIIPKTGSWRMDALVNNNSNTNCYIMKNGIAVSIITWEPVTTPYSGAMGGYPFSKGDLIQMTCDDANTAWSAKGSDVAGAWSNVFALAEVPT